MIVRAQRRRVLAVDAESPGHAEMRQPDLAGFQMNEQVLAAPVDALDRPAAQPLGEAHRQRKAQVGAALRHLHQAPAGKHRHEAPPHGLDLGKLGHAVS